MQDLTLEEKQSRFFLSRIKGIGIKTFKKIINVFDSATNFITASKKDLNKVFDKNFVENYLQQCDVFDIQSELEILKNLEINFIVYGEHEYPELLQQIQDSPICLFYKTKNDFSILKNCITIVGTRNNTNYGQKILEKIIPFFVEKNITILSGMAFGIDKLAHEITLNNDGKTVCVLASPLNNPTPKRNLKLFNEIIQKGIVISEYFPGTQVKKGNFASRNRILAGLSKSTVIVEAPERSGALITAHLAFDYNREVFAFPGNVGNKYSKGCNKLIKINKAKLVENAEDILTELGYIFLENKKSNPQITLSQLQKEIIDIISIKPSTIDSLCKILTASSNEVISALTELEIHDCIFKNYFEEYQIII